MKRTAMGAVAGERLKQAYHWPRRHPFLCGAYGDAFSLVVLVLGAGGKPDQKRFRRLGAIPDPSPESPGSAGLGSRSSSSYPVSSSPIRLPAPRRSAFLRSRILRLYPSAWICATATLVTVFLLGRGNSDTISEYARAMTLWVQGPWIDGVYWTLGIEIIFYAVIFVVLCLGRFGSISIVLGAMTLISAAFWGALAIDRVLPGMLPVAFRARSARLSRIGVSAAAPWMFLCPRGIVVALPVQAIHAVADVFARRFAC